MVRFDEFERLGVAVAAISEKSDGDCARNSAPQEALRAVRAQVCTTCQIDPGTLVCAGQVHGAAIAEALAEDVGRGVAETSPAFPATDGMITRERGLPLAVFVADCVPVYLYDVRTGCGGLVHAGRAGILLDIAGTAAARLVQRFSSDPKDLHALIGPSAGPCCYEVSPEIARTFHDAQLPVRDRHLDLWESNRLQLVRCGVPRAQITITGMCTLCSGRFFSYRGGARTARNMALLML